MKYVIKSIEHNSGQMNAIDQNTKQERLVKWDKIELDVEDPINKTEFGLPVYKHHSVSIEQWNKFNSGITISPQLYGAMINIEYDTTKSGRAVLCDCSIQRKTQ